MKAQDRCSVVVGGQVWQQNVLVLPLKPALNRFNSSARVEALLTEADVCSLV